MVVRVSGHIVTRTAPVEACVSTLSRPTRILSGSPTHLTTCFTKVPFPLKYVHRTNAALAGD